MVQTRRLTVEEFERLAERPENADKRLEYIGGDVIEVVSNNYSSEIAMLIGARLLVFVREQNLGLRRRVQMAVMWFRTAVISRMWRLFQTEKQPEPSHDTYIPKPA